MDCISPRDRINEVCHELRIAYAWYLKNRFWGRFRKDVINENKRKQISLLIAKLLYSWLINWLID